MVTVVNMGVFYFVLNHFGVDFGLGMQASKQASTAFDYANWAVLLVLLPLQDPPPPPPPLFISGRQEVLAVYQTFVNDSEVSSRLMFSLGVYVLLSINQIVSQSGIFFSARLSMLGMGGIDAFQDLW